LEDDAQKLLPVSCTKGREKAIVVNALLENCI
jgi:hypothetical protein